jgi:HPt (histidine-containing phosphotransfer) domain-containing protein
VIFQLDDDSRLPPHLLELFLRATPAQVEQLVLACEARDVERARATAHKLKGSLYAAGASRLAAELESLRALLEAGDFVAGERQLRAVRDDFGRLLRELERQLKEASA